jgi:hypothetical protein
LGALLTSRDAQCVDACVRHRRGTAGGLSWSWWFLLIIIVAMFGHAQYRYNKLMKTHFL